MYTETPGHETVHPDDQPQSVEAEFANFVRYVDLYLRQKTDLFIQHYVLDTFEFIVKQVVYLSVLASLLVVGTLALAIGAVLFISTLIPLWAALLIAGVVAILLAGAIAYVLFKNKLILKTPKSTEVMEHGH